MAREGDQGGAGAGARWRAALLAAAMVAMMFANTAYAQTKSKDARQLDPADQLEEACDELRRAAVKGPYGWGWPSDTASDAEAAATPKEPPRRGRNAPAPDIDLRATAAAGLVLQLASKELNGAANAEAALQAARAIAATQLSTGQIPPSARLVPKPAGHQENIGIVPDRGPTCAALGLLLVVIDASKDKPDPRVVTSATRAATWLARQQTASGGWQSAYPPGPGVTARRIIRLDGPGYRDATLALLLASRVLGRQEYAMAADRSIDQLLRLRIRTEGSPGAGLWGTAHTLGGDVVGDIDELPYGIDLLATRYAMEMLLTAQLVTGRANLSKDLATAAKAAAALPKEDGHWQRRYDLFLRKPAEAPPSEESKDTSDDDVKDKDTDKEPAAPDPFDEAAYAGLLQTVNASLAKGSAAQARELWAPATADARLARTISGISADPFTLRPPTEGLPERVRDCLTPLARMTGK